MTSIKNKEIHIEQSSIDEKTKKGIDSSVKLFIGIPHNLDKISMNFISCLEYMKCFIGGEWENIDPGTFRNKSNGWYIQFESSHTIEIQRNNICLNAKKSGCTHILMIDSDMSFMPDYPYQMLKEKKEIIYPLFFLRRPTDMKFNIPLYDKNRKFIGKEIGLFHGLVNGNFYMGSGSLLFDIKLLNKIKFPYFHTNINYCDFKSIVVGEDMYFCAQLCKKEINMVINTDIILAHDGYIQLPYEMYYLPSINVRRIIKGE